MNLYELTKEWGDLLSLLQDANEDKTIAALDLYVAFQNIDTERKLKLENCRKVLANIEKEIKGTEFEIERLKKIRDKHSAAYDSICSLVKGCLMPDEKFDSPIGGFSWRESSATVCTDESAPIPKAYQRIKIEPDKKLIKSAIEAGKKIKGWMIETRKNLQVK